MGMYYQESNVKHTSALRETGSQHVGRHLLRDVARALRVEQVERQHELLLTRCLLVEHRQTVDQIFKRDLLIVKENKKSAHCFMIMARGGGFIVQIGFAPLH